MSRPHTYPRGAWWYLIRPEYQMVVQALLKHPVSTFAQLRVYTGLSHAELRSRLVALTNTGIVNQVKLQSPYRYCIYNLNPAHIPALINDFQEATS